MSEVLIYRLFKNRDAILEDLEADQVLDFLYQEDVLDGDSYEEVRDKGPRKKQAALLLSYVETKSSTIEKMIEALEQSSQKHLAKILQEPLDNEVELSKGISKSFHNDCDYIYPMTHVPCGYAVIINNAIFEEHTKLEFRKGSEEDVVKMTELFEYLQFKVEVYENQTELEIMHIIRKYVLKVDHKEFDCFVLFLMSHGFPQGIFGTDGKKVHLQSIKKDLTADGCVSLANKPKLIFVQACRGKNADEPYIVTDSPSLPGPSPRSTQEGDSYPTYTPGNLDTTPYDYDPLELPEVNNQCIPQNTDIYTAYASTAGYAALRHTVTGGWFVTHLYEVMRKWAETKDLHSMLTKVARRVAAKRSEKNDYMQCPQFEGNLRGKVVFNPKKSSS